MKKIVFCTLLMCLILPSCSVSRKHKDGFMNVYRFESMGSILPAYINLMPSINTYEYYFVGAYSIIIGDYNIQGDTLQLIPRYRYHESPHEIEKLDSLYWQPNYYLMKGKELHYIPENGVNPGILLW